MDPAFAIPLAAFLGVLGILLLRSGWQRPERGRAPRRSPIVGAGWAALALGAVLAAIGAGAWGIAVASLPAMGTALLLLAFAASRSVPVRTQRETRVRAVAAQAPRRIGGRIASFLLIAVGAFAAAIALALGARWLTFVAGWGEANANVTMMFVQPLAWATIATALLLASSRKRQFAILALCTAPALPALI